MTCKEIRENIPALIRRELSGYVRIPIINHLQECDACKNEYKQYLKIFYSIDMELISKPMATVSVGSLQNLVQEQDSIQKHKELSWKKILYAAAAIIILGMILSGYYYYRQAPDKYSHSFLVHFGYNNNPEFGSVYLNSDPRITAMLTKDRISLNFIENQLLDMQKNGISYFKFNRLTLPVAAQGSGLFSAIYNKSLPVDNCLQKVQSAKKYKSYLTVSELISFLNIIQKQGA